MSGISGIYRFDDRPIDAQILRDSIDVAGYRGRDASNVWVGDRIGVAHLATHTTPESVWCEQPYLDRDRGLVVTADLRLDNRGWLFDQCGGDLNERRDRVADVQLLARAYDRWGEQCPTHLVGDFAFAIWDLNKRILFLARDALGIKPLHYCITRDGCCFATDVAQLLAFPLVPRALNEAAIASFLLGGAGHDLRDTFFADIHMLAPGTTQTIGPEKQSTHRYWDPYAVPEIRYDRDEEYVAHFRELFLRSVTDRLRSNRTAVGMWLSGGLDSTAVAAAACSSSAAGVEFHGYTARFKNVVSVR